MKKVNVLQLVAALCLLFGSLINLVGAFWELPLVLIIGASVLLIASIILHGIFWRQQVEAQKQSKTEATEKKNESEEPK